MSYRGFKTTQGSVYSLDDMGQVVRFLNASPNGPLLDRPDLCLFAPPKAIADIDAHYLGFESGREIDLCLKGRQPRLLIAESGKLLAENVIRIFPEIGFLAIEKTDGVTRIGEPVMEVYHNENDLKASVPDQWHDMATMPERRNLIRAIRPPRQAL